MSQYSFGSGVLFGKKLGATTPQVARFGAIQGVSIDFQFTTKQLFGQNQFPVALGRGTAKITGKAQFGQLVAQTYNDLFFGESSDPATGSIVTQLDEAQTITANAVNVTHNSTAFVRDLGVINANTGQALTRVSASPIGQQYTCNESSGAYTFNNSINNSAVLVSYQWNDSGNGKTITVTNKLLGNAPQFMIVLTETFNAKKFNLTLNACMSSKLSIPFKMEDFTITDLDFEAFADAAGNIGTFSLDE